MLKNIEHSRQENIFNPDIASTPIVKLIEQYPNASTEEIFEMLKEEDSIMLL